MDAKLKKNYLYKIYDCFMYYDEDVILDLRLNYLNKYVDKFVIVESGFFHNGKKRKFNFDIKKYKKFSNKIIYIKVNRKPKNIPVIKKTDNEVEKMHKNILIGYAWDNYQRNKINEGLKKIKSNDIVIISDIDEIPKLENINFDQIKNKIIFFKQALLVYKFNLIYKGRFWFGSKACRKKHLLSPQWLRNMKQNKYKFWRLDVLFSKNKTLDNYHVEDGGWHFTNIKSPEKILKKLKNYAHYYEFNQSKLGLIDIKKMIKAKRAIYNHELDQRKNKFDGKIKLFKCSKKFLPNYLIDNLKKYKKWMA